VSLSESHTSELDGWNFFMVMHPYILILVLITNERLILPVDTSCNHFDNHCMWWCMFRLWSSQMKWCDWALILLRTCCDGWWDSKCCGFYFESHCAVVVSVGMAWRLLLLGGGLLYGEAITAIFPWQTFFS